MLCYTPLFFHVLMIPRGSLYWGYSTAAISSIFNNSTARRASCSSVDVARFLPTNAVQSFLFFEGKVTGSTPHQAKHAPWTISVTAPEWRKKRGILPPKRISRRMEFWKFGDPPHLQILKI